MIEFEGLPGNWKEKAKQLFGTEATYYIELDGPKKIWIDDNCPIQISIVIVDENSQVYRLDDPGITNLILRSSTLPPILTELNFPPIHLFSESPHLN